MPRPIMDWDLISKAISFYQARGFTYVETPWFVSQEALIATLPEKKSGLGQKIADGYLVGSAEQGFVQRMLEGSLPPGRFVSAGPCHREDDEDELHQRTFLKVELIEVFGSEECTFANVLNPAVTFFQNLVPKKYGLETVPTSEGADIFLDGIEIGSYGVRKHGAFRWAYGTGIALPRFSVALRKAITKRWPPYGMVPPG